MFQAWKSFYPILNTTSTDSAGWKCLWARFAIVLFPTGWSWARRGAILGPSPQKNACWAQIRCKMCPQPSWWTQIMRQMCPSPQKNACWAQIRCKMCPQRPRAPEQRLRATPPSLRTTHPVRHRHPKSAALVSNRLLPATQKYTPYLISSTFLGLQLSSIALLRLCLWR